MDDPDRALRRGPSMRSDLRSSILKRSSVAKFPVLRPSIRINSASDQLPKPRPQRVLDANGQDRTPARLVLGPVGCDPPPGPGCEREGPQAARAWLHRLSAALSRDENPDSQPSVYLDCTTFPGPAEEPAPCAAPAQAAGTDSWLGLLNSLADAVVLQPVGRGRQGSVVAGDLRSIPSESALSGFAPNGSRGRSPAGSVIGTGRSSQHIGVEPALGRLASGGWESRPDNRGSVHRPTAATMGRSPSFGTDRGGGRPTALGPSPSFARSGSFGRDGPADGGAGNRLGRASVLRRRDRGRAGSGYAPGLAGGDALAVIASKAAYHLHAPHQSVWQPASGTAASPASLQQLEALAPALGSKLRWVEAHLASAAVLHAEPAAPCTGAAAAAGLESLAPSRASVLLPAPAEKAAAAGAVRHLWAWGAAGAAHDLPVTCFAGSQAQPTLLAAGHGGLEPAAGATPTAGGVALYSLADPAAPLGCLSLACGTTAVALSQAEPWVLAVGLGDGSVELHSIAAGGGGSGRSLPDTRIARAPPKRPNGSGAHVGPVIALRFVRCGGAELLLSAGADGRVLEWRGPGLAACSEVAVLPRPQGGLPTVHGLAACAAGAACEAAMHAAQQLVAAAGGATCLEVLPAVAGHDCQPSSTGRLRRAPAVEGGPRQPGPALLLGSDDGAIYEYELAATQGAGVESPGPGSAPPAARAGATQAPVHAWRLATTYSGHAAAVRQVARSPFDRAVFASCGADRTVRIWRRGCRAPLLALGRQPGQRSDYLWVCWSPADELALVAASPGGLEIWDLGHSVTRPLGVCATPGPRFTAAALPAAAATGALAARGPLLLCGAQDGGVCVHRLPPAVGIPASDEPGREPGRRLRKALAAHAAPADGALP